MVQGKPIEAYRNMYANLALPLFAASEPAPPKVFHFNSMKWSLWNRWILEGDLTVQQVLDWFKVRSALHVAEPVSWVLQLQKLPQCVCLGYCYLSNHVKADPLSLNWGNKL